MIVWSDLQSKVKTIRTSFESLIGVTITRYETAEILHGSTWHQWPDLPIRLYAADGQLVAVAWSKFDDLWLASDESLPFSTDGSTVRWVTNSLKGLEPMVGASIVSVLLGRGEMTLVGRDIEIWTRLLIEVDSGWLEVFNALDENGYAFHTDRPSGEFVRCT